MGCPWEGRGAVEENSIALVGAPFNAQGCDKRVMPRTFRLAGIIFSALEPETIRGFGGRFPSAHSKKSQSFSGPLLRTPSPDHRRISRICDLYLHRLFGVCSSAGLLLSQSGWSGFEAETDGVRRVGWTGRAGRRGGGGGAKCVR